MERKHNKNIVPIAKMLRKNMTKEEKHLWYDFLRTHKVKFTRQKVLGKYVADFYSAKAKLVIEVDGAQHYTEQGKEKDEFRTSLLEEFDLLVLRFTNHQINTNFKGVCEFIDIMVKQRTNK